MALGMNGYNSHPNRLTRRVITPARTQVAAILRTDAREKKHFELKPPAHVRHGLKATKSVQKVASDPFLVPIVTFMEKTEELLEVAVITYMKLDPSRYSF